MMTVDEALNHAQNELESAFEKWLSDECPSGDCESVQHQWDESFVHQELVDELQPVMALTWEVRRLREENERKNRLFADAVSALAAIDAALGMPEDGCNSTDKTITAIKLMHAVRVDDEKEITRLTEENERLRKDAERGQFLVDRGEWFRHNHDTPHAYALLAIRLPYTADLSCKAMREDAIDAARGAK